MTPQDLTVVAFSSEIDRSQFSCGNDALDRYFRNQAGQDQRRNISKCYVATHLEGSKIVGFYTLVSAGIDAGEIPDGLRRRLPLYEALPAVLIGRLAIDRGSQGKGLGRAILYDAIDRALGSTAAVFAIVVDATDENAAAFYRHYQFQPFASRPSRLYLPAAFFTKLTEP